MRMSIAFWRRKPKGVIVKEKTIIPKLRNGQTLYSVSSFQLEKIPLALTYFLVCCFQSLLTLFHAFLIDVPITHYCWRMKTESQSQAAIFRTFAA